MSPVERWQLIPRYLQCVYQVLGALQHGTGGSKFGFHLRWQRAVRVHLGA